jgi:hypothetical protein
MTEGICMVCGGTMAIPAVHPSSGVWTHTELRACVAVLHAQRETLQGENAAWRKRSDQAEADSSALKAERDRLEAGWRKERVEHVTDIQCAERRLLKVEAARDRLRAALEAVYHCNGSDGLCGSCRDRARAALAPDTPEQYHCVACGRDHAAPLVGGEPPCREYRDQPSHSLGECSHSRGAALAPDAAKEGT